MKQNNKANITGYVSAVSFVTGKLLKRNISGGKLTSLNMIGVLKRSDYVPQPEPPPVINSLKTLWNIQSVEFTFPSLSTEVVTGKIDWGDGTHEDYTSGTAFSHSYAETGTYTVTVDCDITAIKDEAFKGRTDLLEITIPDSVISIGDYLFSKCTALRSVILPESLTTIGAATFHYTPALKTVGIPTSVTKIGNACFWACGVTSIVIPNTITTLYSTFDHCIGLVSVSLPSTLTKIDSYTFNYCTSLKSIDIPSTVETIASSAFSNTYDMEIRVHKPTNGISGSPWGAIRATVIWEDTQST